MSSLFALAMAVAALVTFGDAAPTIKKGLLSDASSPCPQWCNSITPVDGPRYITNAVLPDLVEMCSRCKNRFAPHIPILDIDALNGIDNNPAVMEKRDDKDVSVSITISTDIQHKDHKHGDLDDYLPAPWGDVPEPSEMEVINDAPIAPTPIVVKKDDVDGADVVAESEMTANEGLGEIAEHPKLVRGPGGRPRPYGFPPMPLLNGNPPPTPEDLDKVFKPHGEGLRPPYLPSIDESPPRLPIDWTKREETAADMLEMSPLFNPFGIWAQGASESEPADERD